MLNRAARWERPLLAAGLSLVTIHLLDLVLSGPDTRLLAVLAIVVVPVALFALAPRVTRATRFAVGVAFGLAFTALGAISHTLHALLHGPDWTDVTGIGFTAGGLALIASGVTALAAPRRAPRRAGLPWCAAHVAGWGVGAFVIASLVFLPLATALFTLHSPRNPVEESSLGIAHEEVRVPTEDGREMAAWYVPSRNGAAVLVTHGSSGNRARVADRARLLARHGYGVLVLDLPGAGESDGHSSGLGDNAQPAIDAGLDYLQRRGADRIAGLGASLGGEVLLEAASHDSRLQAVVSDGAARPEDASKYDDNPVRNVAMGLARGISGMDAAPPLTERVPQIEQPVLLIAAGGDPAEIPTNRDYARLSGADLWEIPEAGHTGGLRARPAEYERRVVAFLDAAMPAPAERPAPAR